MKKSTLFITVLVVLAVVSDISAKKLSRSRSSSSSRRKSQPQPAPTSFSHPQPASAPKPSLFGWQEKPAQKTQTSWQQAQPSNKGHSYPSSNTGLSGNNQAKQPSIHQESIHKSSAPVQHSAPQSNQNGHSYPASTGLSGSSGGGYPQPKQPPSYQESIQRSNVPVQQSAPAHSPSGHSYPASNGLSGSGGSSSGVGYPQGQGLSGHNAAPPPYQSVNYNKPPAGSGYPHSNTGNNYNQGAPPPYSSGGNGYNHHPQGPPPPYSAGHGYGGYGGPGQYSPQAPGYFGNYANSGRGFGGVSRTGSALTGVGIAGAGIGTVLTGLALWNLARSTGHHHNTVIYDNRGQPVAVAPNNSTTPVVDPILGDLVNCTLTIDSENATEVLAIPCSIATSFTPEADVKDVSMKNQTDDKTKCTITVVTKAGKEFLTTIPCSVLLNTAAENNVTEPPILEPEPKIENGTAFANSTETTIVTSDQPTALRLSTNEENAKLEDTDLNCTKEEGDVRDPINPCFTVKHNLTVIPLDTTEPQKTDI